MTYRQAMRRARAKYLSEVVAASKTITEAAKRAGLSRSHFYRICYLSGVRIIRRDVG